MKTIHIITLVCSIFVISCSSNEIADSKNTEFELFGSTEWITLPDNMNSLISDDLLNRISNFREASRYDEMNALYEELSYEARITLYVMRLKSLIESQKEMTTVDPLWNLTQSVDNYLENTFSDLDYTNEQIDLQFTYKIPASVTTPEGSFAYDEFLQLTRTQENEYFERFYNLGVENPFTSNPSYFIDDPKRTYVAEQKIDKSEGKLFRFYPDFSWKRLNNEIIITRSFNGTGFQPVDQVENFFKNSNFTFRFDKSGELKVEVPYSLFNESLFVASWDSNGEGSWQIIDTDGIVLESGVW